MEAGLSSKSLPGSSFTATRVTDSCLRSVLCRISSVMARHDRTPPPLKRNCPYCGEIMGVPGRKTSQEHVLGEAILRELGLLKSEQRFVFMQREELDPGSEITVRRKTYMAQQTKRTVCEPCNNGWMSRLQKDAKPLVVSLTNEKIGIYDLTTEQKCLLAHWTLMTACSTSASVRQDLSNVPPEHYQAVMKGEWPVGAFAFAVYLPSDQDYTGATLSGKIRELAVQSTVIPSRRHQSCYVALAAYHHFAIGIAYLNPEHGQLTLQQFAHLPFYGQGSLLMAQDIVSLPKDMYDEIVSPSVVNTVMCGVTCIEHGREFNIAVAPDWMAHVMVNNADGEPTPEVETAIEIVGELRRLGFHKSSIPREGIICSTHRDKYPAGPCGRHIPQEWKGQMKID